MRQLLLKVKDHVYLANSVWFTIVETGIKVTIS